MTLRIGMLKREPEAISLIHYREKLSDEFGSLGISVIPFSENDPFPTCDVIWDPGMGRNRLPHPLFKELEIPIVVTLHGSASFTLPWREVYSRGLDALVDRLKNIKAMREWSWFRRKVSRVIAVSNFGATEAIQVYGLSEPLVTSIYHGIDHGTFTSQLETPPEDYFLHVSAYQPKKNINRLIGAYAQLPENSRPRLVVVSPGYRRPGQSISGLTICSRALSSAELACLYEKALAFVFPSLHETFGFPIVEAMACGCPVITSHDTACAEIAESAAFLVNPRSINDIAEAMSLIARDLQLRERLRQSGLARAKQFTWERCALEHMRMFESTISA